MNDLPESTSTEQPKTGVTLRSVTTAAYIFIARSIALLANVIIVVLVTRYLGIEMFGKYTFAMGYYFLAVSTLAMGGAVTVLIRESARDLSKAGENLGHALQVQGVFTIIVMALALLILPFFSTDPLVNKAIYINLATGVVQVVGNLYNSLFTAYENTRHMAISSFLERAVYLAGIILVLTFDWGFLAIFWFMLVSFSVRLLYVAIVVQIRFTPLKVRLHRESFVHFFRESLPLLFSAGFRSLNNQLGTLLLQLFQTAAELGLYGAPYRIITRLDIVPDSVMAGLLPALSNIAKDARDNLVRIYGKIFKLFLVISLPMAVLLSLFSRPIMVTVFGSDFAAGAPAMSIMAWVIVFMFMNFLFKYLLTAVRQQQYETLSLGISFIVHLGAGLWLIPLWGATGAAATMLFGQVVAFVLGFYYVHNKVGPYHPWETVWKLGIGALPAFLVSMVWSDGPFPLPLLLAGISYLVLIIVMKVFVRSEIDMLIHSCQPLSTFFRWLAPAHSVKREGAE